jgi:tetratricopeptide (TPR) repeat protein
MDCQSAQKGEMVERYVLGRLDDATQEAFEQHFFECVRCFEDVQICRALQGELERTGAAVQAEPRRTVVVARWRWAVSFALAVAVLVVAWRWQFSPSTDHPATPVAVKPSSGTEPQPGPQSQSPVAHVPDVPSLAELAQVTPPPYAPVTLRGTPGEAGLRFRAAMQHYQEGDYRAAIPGLRAAVELNPEAVDANFFLAVCRLLEGQTNAAIAGLRRTIALGDSPFLEEAHIYLAKAYLRKADLVSARGELDQAIRLHGDRQREVRQLLEEIKKLDGESR